MIRTIHDYRNHRAYANCPRGFVVTGSNRERDHDQWNRDFVGNNETGMWIVAPDRVLEGDAMFVLLPNPARRDGYPRQLFGGVVTGWRYEGDRTIFKVREFIELSPIDAEIKQFLGGKVPPQGNTVGTLWEVSDQKSMPRQSVVNEDFERQVRRAATLSPEDREVCMRAWSPRPERIEVTSTAFVRNPYVVAIALERANGSCEDCEEPAPFVRKSDGSPYLEVHHVQPLADNGEDTVENAIALCPNCHRKRHFG
jgi:5-methylcytosine-specific restriction endonuclease McrA